MDLSPDSHGARHRMHNLPAQNIYAASLSINIRLPIIHCTVHGETQLVTLQS